MRSLVRKGTIISFFKVSKDTLTRLVMLLRTLTRRDIFQKECTCRIVRRDLFGGNNKTGIHLLVMQPMMRTKCFSNSKE